MKRMIFAAIAAFALCAVLAPTPSSAWGWRGGWHPHPYFYGPPMYQPYMPYAPMYPSFSYYNYSYGQPYVMQGPRVVVHHYWWSRTRVYHWGSQGCDVCY